MQKVLQRGAVEKCCDTCNQVIELCQLEIDRRNMKLSNDDFMTHRAYYILYGCPNYQ